MKGKGYYSMYSLPANFHISSFLIRFSETPNIIILSLAFSLSWMTHHSTIIANRIVLILVDAVSDFVKIVNIHLPYRKLYFFVSMLGL